MMKTLVAMLLCSDKYLTWGGKIKWKTKKTKQLPSLSKSHREEIMLLEGITLYANIHKWRNPRTEFFLNISRGGDLTASGCSSPENQNLHLFVGLLRYASKVHEFQWGFFCCCRYAVTMRLLKVSLQKLRINWADRMILCAPGKWIVHLITVECSITQAKLSVDINVLIFTPINCMYLGEINYCSSYLLLPNKILFKVEFVL